MFAVLAVPALWLVLAWGEAATPAAEPILSGPLVKLDIKDAEVAAVRGNPKGALTIGMHFALDPGWLAPLEHIPANTQQHYDSLLHDALIKPMPQGEVTYSLAEHAEVAADFTKAAFRLRPGLKFHDGHALTTADVKWTYENYKGVHAKTFRDKLERIEIVDDRTIIFHFKEPFVDFLDLYNGVTTGIGWIVPKHYYEPAGRAGVKAHPIGAGPFAWRSAGNSWCARRPRVSAFPGATGSARKSATPCAGMGRTCRCRSTTRRRPSNCWRRRASPTALIWNGTCPFHPTLTWASASSLIYAPLAFAPRCRPWRDRSSAPRSPRVARATRATVPWSRTLTHG